MLLQLNGVLPVKTGETLVANQDPKNPIVMMMDSGARGNISNFTACRYAWSDGGPERAYHKVANPFKLPRRFVLLEMFFSTHGARKV